MASSSGAQLPIRVGILTVSDRCHAGQMTDTSGPNLSNLVKTLINNGVVAELAVVPDEEKDIKSKLLQWCDQDKLNVIFTSGGTGFAQRDITPEVTKLVIHKEAPGMVVAMLKSSLDVTSMAMLSRPVCGIRDNTVIINLPGSKKGSEECFRFVLPALTHAVNLVRGDNQQVKSTHDVVQAGVQNTLTSHTDIHTDIRMDDTTDGDCQYDMSRDDTGEKALNKPLSDATRDKPAHRSDGDLLTEPTLFHSFPDSTKNVPDTFQDFSSEQSFRTHKMPRTQAQKKLYAGTYSGLIETNAIGNGALCNTMAQTMTAFPSHNKVMLISENQQEEMTIEEPDNLDNHSKDADGNTPLPEDDSNTINDTTDNSTDCLENSYIQPSNTRELNNRFNEPMQVDGSGVSENVHKAIDAEDLNISECAQVLCEMSQQAVVGKNKTYSQLKEAVAADENQNKDPAKGQDDGNTNKESSKKKYRVLSTKPKRHQREAEVCFAQVGESAKIWTMKHPLINGIYLNKGKREIKKHLVRLKRQPTAVDKTSYLRNGKVNDRNRIDDYFEFTEEGKKKREQFEEGLVRDEYVVNWYMWCPGHGNCYRPCGGYGKCVEGCPGNKHKQDRHNCSLMINWKLYLSDLDRWMIQLTGSHVPLGSGITWSLPTGMKERLDEDTRDIILECSEKAVKSTKIEQLLTTQMTTLARRKVPSSKQIGRFMFNRKRREHIRCQNVRERLGNDENTTNYSCADGDPGGVYSETSQEVSSETGIGSSKDQVENNTKDNDKEVSNPVDEHDGIVNTNTVSVCSNIPMNDNANPGLVFAYYDQTQVPNVFTSSSNLINPSQDQNLFNMYTASKMENQNEHFIMEQSFSQLPSGIQFPTNSLGQTGSEFTGVMGNHVTQLGPDSIGPVSQPVQILPQLPPTLSGLQVISVDSEGQPIYGNCGDIQSLIVACQQQSSI